MPSTEYTAKNFWEQARRPFPVEKVDAIAYAKYKIMFQAIVDVAAQIYDVIGSAFMRTTPVSASAAGNYSTAAGTWTASTRTLTQTMNANFVAGDLGKLVTFRDGSSTYLGVIETVSATNAVILSGYNLPVGNIASVANWTTVLDSAIGSAAIDISNLRMMRTAQMKIELESTASDSIEWVTSRGLRAWRNSGTNRKRIAATVQGNEVRYTLGEDLSSIGTVTLRYPGLPLEPTQDSSAIDMVGGAPMRLSILRTQVLIGRAIDPPQLLDVSNEMDGVIKSIYGTRQNDAAVLTATAKRIVTALA